MRRGRPRIYATPQEASRERNRRRRLRRQNPGSQPQPRANPTSRLHASPWENLVLTWDPRQSAQPTQLPPEPSHNISIEIPPALDVIESTSDSSAHPQVTRPSPSVTTHGEHSIEPEPQVPLPRTFKQAAFKKAGGPLIIEEVPLIPPGPSEILLKVEACGVCHSDVYAQNNAMGGGFPLVPGHEIIGRVAAVGSAVSGWQIGDRVGGAWHAGHDGTCNACRKGWNQMCENQVINGITKGGGYAEYCLLRAEAAVRVPDHVDAAKYAPILCAGVAVFNSIRQMQVRVGETVAIQGMGGLGHLAIQYANQFGYRVVAISRGSVKEGFARQLGAHHYIDTNKEDASQALQKLGGAALIVTTTPDSNDITPLMKGLAVVGKLLILSLSGKLPVDTGLMLRYGLSIHTWRSGHVRDSEEAIAFTELRNINCMVETFPLEQANEAFDAMLEGNVRFRAVITME